MILILLRVFPLVESPNSVANVIYFLYWDKSYIENKIYKALYISSQIWKFELFTSAGITWVWSWRKSTYLLSSLDYFGESESELWSCNTQVQNLLGDHLCSIGTSWKVSKHLDEHYKHVLDTLLWAACKLNFTTCSHVKANNS